MQRIHEALAALEAAARPVIVAGGGVMSSHAQPELVALAEKLNIPVATSLNAKAAIADEHRLCVGVPGAYSRDCANRTLAEADLVFFIGSHAGGQVTNNWMFPPPGTRVIQLDIDAAELGRNYPNAVSILADAKAALKRMLTRRQPSRLRNVRMARAGAEVRFGIARRERADAKFRCRTDPSRAHMQRNFQRASTRWHRRLRHRPCRNLDRAHDRARLSAQSYYRTAGSLGWGFPAALGVKCAMPGRPVVCFTGDGGFYYHIAELETARRHNINAVIVVNNNSGLNQEIKLNDMAYGGKQHGRAEEMWRFPISTSRRSPKRSAARAFVSSGPVI